MLALHGGVLFPPPRIDFYGIYKLRIFVYTQPGLVIYY
jgi:hypothetical protein